MPISMPGQQGAGGQGGTVRSPPPPGLIIIVWSVRLLLIAAAIALTVVWTPFFTDMVLGRRSLDVLVLVAIPLALAFVIYLAYRAVRLSPRFLRPDVFSADGFDIFGVRRSWDIVDRVYWNPWLSYLTILFKEVQWPQMAGVALFKKKLEPSVAAFLALVRAKNIPIEEQGQLTAAELTKLGYDWAKKRAGSGESLVR